MGSETGLVLIIALLWGPTALWLFYVAARGRSARITSVIHALTEPDRGVELAFDTVDELVAKGQFWVCERCRSLNSHLDKRCYSCRVERGAPSPPAPGESPAADEPLARPLVPVMAEEIVRSARARSAPAGSPILTLPPVHAGPLSEPTGRSSRTPGGKDPSKPKERGSKPKERGSKPKERAARLAASLGTPPDAAPDLPGAMVPIMAQRVAGRSKGGSGVGSTAEPDERPRRARHKS